MEENTLIIPDERIIGKIYVFRGQKVMLDFDLAELYGIETRRLNEQVKRNLFRFPKDFMFQPAEKEAAILMSQFAISKSEGENRGGRRKLPYVFTEHGILMLSGILNSQRAIDINVQIIRLFIKMRDMLLTHKDILMELEDIRKSVSNQDERIDLIYNYLKQFIQQETSRSKIGFKTT